MRLAEVDRSLVALLRARLAAGSGVAVNPRASTDVLVRAEQHGVAGLVVDALVATGGLPPDVVAQHRARALARELDHAAHLATLRAIDGALRAAGVSAVVLKGALLALRLWPEPATRATTDVDLLVREADLAVTADALATTGYVAAMGPEEERFRREHHHLHLAHPHGPPLELHFHAYRGFGRVMRSEPLVARAIPTPLEGATALGTLEPSDELLYLAVHAAAHRFVRLGWLVDLVLLAQTMSPAALDAARARARSLGYARALAFAAGLAEPLGLARDAARRLGAPGDAAGRIAALVYDEPRSRVLASATRLVYTAALCDDRHAALRYAREATTRHLRALVGAGP